jgi:adenine-specific DNA-methyltransferase
VLKILQESYLGRIKMIYIDPPYNTGHDFVYRDNFTVDRDRELFESGQTDEYSRRLVTNPESSGRYHSDWLSMMYPRLKLARNMLTDDGVIFISIDDNEVHNMRKLCDEIFGEGNFVSQFPWRKRTAKSDVPFGVSQDYEWILCYAKSTDFFACIEGGTRKYYDTEDLPGKLWRVHDLTTQRSAQERPNSNYTMINPKNKKEYPVNPKRVWAVTIDTFEKYYNENRIVFPGDYDFLNISNPVFRYFKDDDMAKAGNMFGFIPVTTKLPDEIGMTQDGTRDLDAVFGQKVFGFPKPISLLKYFLKISIPVKNSLSITHFPIILDFFSGSATTAHAVMQLNAEDGGNRKFIMVQLPEVTDEASEA